MPRAETGHKVAFREHPRTWLLRLHAPPERFHDIDDVRWLPLLRPLDPFATLLFPQQFLSAHLLKISEFIRMKMSGLPLYDV